MNSYPLESSESLYLDAKNALRYLQNNRHYRYIEFLDEGGYGWVALMYDDTENQLLAIKCTKDPAELELSHWPNLQHPNIMPLLETLTLDSTTVFIMPAHRKDLFQHISEGTFYEDEVSFGLCRVWLKDVASGLAYLHSNGLCHLDLKLDNIFLKDNGRVCVGDFSLLSHVNAVPLGFEFLEMQRPPEFVSIWEENDEIESEPLDGERVDLWQFGILSVDLLTNLKLSEDVSSYPIWNLDVLPFIHKVLDNVDYWQYIIEKCFCRELNEEENLYSHDFISKLLAFESHKRMTASVASKHEFTDVDWPQISKVVVHSFEEFDPIEGGSLDGLVKQEFVRLRSTPHPGIKSALFSGITVPHESHGEVKHKKKKKKHKKKLKLGTDDHALKLIPDKVHKDTHVATVNDKVESKKIITKKKHKLHSHDKKS